jgi:chromosome segregation ATPase
MAAAAKEIEAEFPMQESTVIETKVGRVHEDLTVLKADVKVLQTDVAVLKADVKVLRSDVNHLQEDVTHIKADVRQLSADLTEHRIETQKSLAKVREDMKDGFAALRAEIASSRIELKESFEKSGDRRFTLIACIFGTVLTTIGTTVAILKFVVAA